MNSFQKSTYIRWLILFMLFSFFLINTSYSAEKFPNPRGYVSDYANVIPPSYDDKITALAREVEQKTGVQIAVVTMEDIDEDYQDYANKLFEAWGIGHKGKDDGILIFDVVRQRKVWIEVDIETRAGHMAWHKETMAVVFIRLYRLLPDWLRRNIKSLSQEV